jgi:hypothetical protein
LRERRLTATAWERGSRSRPAGAGKWLSAVAAEAISPPTIRASTSVWVRRVASNHLRSAGLPETSIAMRVCRLIVSTVCEKERRQCLRSWEAMVNSTVAAVAACRGVARPPAQAPSLPAIVNTLLHQITKLLSGPILWSRECIGCVILGVQCGMVFHTVSSNHGQDAQTSNLALYDGGRGYGGRSDSSAVSRSVPKAYGSRRNRSTGSRGRFFFSARSRLCPSNESDRV